MIHVLLARKPAGLTLSLGNLFAIGGDMEPINLQFPTLEWSNLVRDAESANMLRRSLVARGLSARLIGETFMAMAVATESS
jgi:hypothetical protein